MSEKRSVAQVLLDKIEEAVKPRYNPSGYRDATMDAEDNARRQKAITLLEVLKESVFPERQRKTICRRVHEIRGGSAFPELGKHFREVTSRLEG
ncbi:MAG: hypothetical protein PHW53_03760 [Patescibacteria group bacterium]|nr:hypothetical protein [Patescibacteria group bacterium]